jgi:tetratricopeptide (TPR) repeat protein
MRALVLVLLLAAPALAAEPAASPDITFRRANEAYFKGDYAEAARGYEQIAQLGVASSDLYYNLGNAYLKLGRLGPAIYQYELALVIDPRQEDVAFNLKTAREAVKQKGQDRLVGADKAPLFERLLALYPIGTLSWIFLGLWISVFTLLTVLRFVGPGFLRVGLRAALAFLALGALVAGALVAGRLYVARYVEQAIILPDKIEVKEGPDASYVSAFAVHAGLRVRVTEKEQDWVRVRLANGLEGWLREADLGRL